MLGRPLRRERVRQALAVEARRIHGLLDACSLPGDYSYTTSGDSLLRMLRTTDLTPTVLDKFPNRIYEPKGASLLAVELSEETLTEIGYFVD